MFRIKEALNYHNLNCRVEDRISVKELSILIFAEDGLSEITAYQRLSHWNHNKRLHSLMPRHIEKICKILKVDANYLFNIEPMK